MTPSRLRLVALAGMVAFLLGAAACAETPENDSIEAKGGYQSRFDEILARTYSLEALQTRANNGDADAQFRLGFRYETGEGVPQDDVEAVAWYRLAAEQGLASAQYKLGSSYASGEGVPQDDAEATVWYRQAAEQGVAEAQATLGYRYANGLGVPQDDAEAVAWTRKAAEQGHATAQFNLGAKYSRGEGVPQDNGEAYLWANLAATYADAEQREGFAKFRDDAGERITLEQRADAQRRAREFFEAHPPK